MPPQVLNMRRVHKIMLMYFYSSLCLHDRRFSADIVPVPHACRQHERTEGVPLQHLHSCKSCNLIRRNEGIGLGKQVQLRRKRSRVLPALP